MEGEEAFYYLHRDRELMGAVITHMDDFIPVGTEKFSLKKFWKLLEESSLFPKLKRINLGIKELCDCSGRWNRDRNGRLCGKS